MPGPPVAPGRWPRRPVSRSPPAQPALCPRRFLTSKEQFHAFLRARGEPGGQAGGEEVEEKEDEEDGDGGSPHNEPPAKRLRPEEPGQDRESREEAGAAEEPAERKRARGQNKSRPCVKPTRYEQNRLCPAVTQVGHGALGVPASDGCSEQFWAGQTQARLASAGRYCCCPKTGFFTQFVNALCLYFLCISYPGVPGWASRGQRFHPPLSRFKGCAEKCYFGARCRFLHDVGEYMATKPGDLGRSCVLFETFGRCVYGVTCRFAQAHLGDGYQNIVNADLAKQWEGRTLVRNNLSKDLQHQLRKKRFDFKKADEYLRGLAKPHSDGGKGGKATGCSAEEQEVSNCTTAQEGPGDGPECPVRSEQGEDPKPDASQSGEEPSSIKTAGPVTDEDLIKLRACEKKKVRVRLRAAVSCLG